MKKLIMNNLGMKILSVFIAILIWLLVANTNDPVITKRFSNIPVTIVNEDVLTSEGYSYEILEGESVYLTVKGKNSILGSMTDDDFLAYADFSKLSVVDAVPIDVEAKRYQSQLEISLGTVNTMKIKRDELVDVNVPVNIVTKGEVADGYAVGKTTGTPNLVKVSGPKNLLKDVKEIQAEIDLDNMSENISTTAAPVIYDEDGEQVDSSQLDMDTTSIQIYVEIWKTKEVDVNIGYEGEPAEGYILTSFDYEPKKITIAAPDTVLSTIDYIDLPDLSLEGQTKDYEESYDLTDDLLPSDKMVVADSNTSVKAQAEIEKIKTRTFTFTESDLTVKNNGGYEVSFANDNTYSFTAEGAESVMNALTMEDFAPWIDLTDLEEGEHTMNLHVKDIEGVTLTGKQEIDVTLESK